MKFSLTRHSDCEEELRKSKQNVKELEDALMMCIGERDSARSELKETRKKLAAVYCKDLTLNVAMEETVEVSRLRRLLHKKEELLRTQAAILEDFVSLHVHRDTDPDPLENPLRR